MKKIINEEELLKLTESERAKVLKEICLGEITYIGGNESGKEERL